MARARQLFRGRHLKLMARGPWEYAERTDARLAVAVVAVTPEGKLVLTEQQRPPVDARVIDLPAGLVGDEEGHEEPETTARLELEEETGFTCDSLQLLTTAPTSPGLTSERVELYRASGVRRIGEGGGVGGEKIAVHEIPVAEALLWLSDRESEGKLIDPKVWVALLFIEQST